MKHAFLITLTFLSCSLLGQQVSFNNEFVDSIFIKAHASVFKFDDKGTTKGKADIISFTYDTARNHYVRDRYYRDTYKRTFNPDTIKLKKKYYSSAIGKSVDFKEIQDLLTSLSTSKSNQELIGQIDTVEIKAYLTERHIRKVAKRSGVDWYFKKKYSSEKENNNFFESCKSIDTLKIYLSERFDTSGYPMITDVSSTFNIWISTENSEYRFEGKLPNPVKQPWYNHSDTTQDYGQAILNFGINQSLTELLPRGFLLTESIFLEALSKGYINWYFGRRDMSY